MSKFFRLKTMQKTNKRAADFVAKSFSGTASADTERELLEWLEESPLHRKAYRDMLDVWDMAGALSPHEPVQAETAPLWKWAAYSMVVLSVATGAFWFSWQETDLARYVTAVGEQKTITLSDGSFVTLNTDSRLIVDYSEDDVMRLFLDRGEAFFDVAKRPSRTFTVKAGTRSITALGTKFSVLRSQGNLTVAVVEGAVAVHKPQELQAATKTILEQLPAEHHLVENVTGPYRIDAGGVATFSNSDHVVARIEAVDIEKHVSWHEGYLRFDDERLDFVVGQMNRYLDRPIVIEDPGVGDLRISGLFQLDDVDGMWRGLERILPVTIEELPNQITIVDRRNEVSN